MTVAPEAASPVSNLLACRNQGQVLQVGHQVYYATLISAAAGAVQAATSTQLSSQLPPVCVTDIRHLQCNGLHRDFTDVDKQYDGSHNQYSDLYLYRTACWSIQPTCLQVWLMLNNLLVDPKARAKYDMDDYRKEAVLRVRRYMNDILLDQLPLLKDLQRVLDELTMGVSSQQDESQTTRLIIEQV